MGKTVLQEPDFSIHARNGAPSDSQSLKNGSTLPQRQFAKYIIRKVDYRHSAVFCNTMSLTLTVVFSLHPPKSRTSISPLDAPFASFAAGTFSTYSS